MIAEPRAADVLLSDLDQVPAGVLEDRDVTGPPSSAAL